MFGYVSPQKSELKVRELTQYQAWYCGLCHTLRAEYGQIPRLTLSYDCTFLALLLASLAGEQPAAAAQRCGYKPFKKKSPVVKRTPALDYAADCNVLLYWYKLRDDWQDERKPVAMGGDLLLRRAAKKARLRQPEIARDIETQLAALTALERQNCEDIDTVADAFAKLLQSLLRQYPPLNDNQRTVLTHMGYHLGRWLYFADACDDRKKDKEKNAYNPFLAANADKERITFSLYASLHEMETAFDLLDTQTNSGLLENIVYRGCRDRTKRLLEEMEA